MTQSPVWWQGPIYYLWGWGIGNVIIGAYLVLTRRAHRLRPRRGSPFSQVKSRAADDLPAADAFASANSSPQNWPVEKQIQARGSRRLGRRQRGAPCRRREAHHHGGAAAGADKPAQLAQTSVLPTQTSRVGQGLSRIWLGVRMAP